MTKNSPNVQDRESVDAEIVDSAMQELMNGNIDKAESLLTKVIANTPSEYTYSLEDDEAVSIKFWDQAEFLQYVTWQKEHGLDKKSINWIGNAYPRAHYYMGFISVKRKQPDRAIDFLNKGLMLEPTNPKFIFEKAKALSLAGRNAESLALYDQVNETGPHVSGHELAVAKRGRGFILIELNHLDAAEEAFNSSLELEPGNSVALNELEYIRHLRQGGVATTRTEVVDSKGPNLSECAVCGKEFDKGVVVSVNGMPVAICERCKSRLTKKWWQFWK